MGPVRSKFEIHNFKSCFLCFHNNTHTHTTHTRPTFSGALFPVALHLNVISGGSLLSSISFFLSLFLGAMRHLPRTEAVTTNDSRTSLQSGHGSICTRI